MKFGTVASSQAVGKILAHAIVDEQGHKVISKGHVLNEADIVRLQTLHIEQIVAVELAANDLGENEAAERVGKALAGMGLRILAPGVGRANVIATQDGPLCVNVTALERLNNIDEGITIASLRQHSLVKEGQLVALVKIIPFGIDAARVIDVEAMARESEPILWVRPLQSRKVSLIVSGPESTRERLLNAFSVPIRTRIENLGSHLENILYVEHQAECIAQAIHLQVEAGAELVMIASISAISDRNDVVPSALREAGGNVAHLGVPVDPGSLMMLGYLGQVPILGTPGCVKSLKTNVVDWVLPRLLAGERLTRVDLVAMGHGGLLDDISERPMPRQHT